LPSRLVKVGKDVKRMDETSGRDGWSDTSLEASFFFFFFFLPMTKREKKALGALSGNYRGGQGEIKLRVSKEFP
jgi:hypothetical protein